MWCVTRSARWLSAVAVVIAVSLPSTADGTVFRVDWDYGLSGFEPPDPNPTAFWDCPGVTGAGLICASLWEQGLEVSSTNDLPMYGDVGPFYDAFGVDLPLESDLPDSDLLSITAVCRAGESPCFSTFTPIRLSLSGFGDEPDIRMFVTSSRGGLRTTSTGVVDLKGEKWTDITSMSVGLYLPNRCGRSDDECERGEQALYINSLVFADRLDQVPEPAVLTMLGAALLLRRVRGRPGGR